MPRMAVGIGVQKGTWLCWPELAQMGDPSCLVLNHFLSGRAQTLVGSGGWSQPGTCLESLPGALKPRTVGWDGLACNLSLPSLLTGFLPSRCHPVPRWPLICSGQLLYFYPLATMWLMGWTHDLCLANQGKDLCLPSLESRFSLCPPSMKRTLRFRPNGWPSRDLTGGLAWSKSESEDIWLRHESRNLRIVTCLPCWVKLHLKAQMPLGFSAGTQSNICAVETTRSWLFVTPGT